MSRSLLYHAFGVREGCDYVRAEYQGGAVWFSLRLQRLPESCARRGEAKLTRHGTRYQEVKTVPIGLKEVWLRCSRCGQITEFVEDVNGGTQHRFIRSAAWPVWNFIAFLNRLVK